jgi:hypothetical protein
MQKRHVGHPGEKAELRTIAGKDAGATTLCLGVTVSPKSAG